MAPTAPTSETWRAIGTTCTVAVTEPGALGAARAAVDAVLRQGDESLSRFRADSELCRLRPGVPTAVSPMLAGAVTAALHAAAATSGLVDPTVGAGMVAAGYDRTFADLRPDPASTLLPVAAPGWRAVRFDASAPGGPTLTVPQGCLLDLGATGKAYLADLAALRAAQATGTGVLVSLGGDLAAVGEAPAGGWSVRVSEDPDDLAATGPGQTIGIAGGGLATSSTLLRRWQRGGRDVHHILEPRTGLPAPVVWRTVTVAAATCVDANTATTASVVLGAQAPGWLAARRLPARLVSASGDVVTVGDWPREEA